MVGFDVFNQFQTRPSGGFFCVRHLVNRAVNGGRMNKIAVFGKPGSGKSTLSKQLANALNIPLHPLDSVQYAANGVPVARDVFDRQHADILASPSWLIDGLGPISAFKQRLAAADTWVYVDLPYWLSYWLVTKRLIKGLLVTPEGWPKGSSVIKGSWRSYQYLRLSPKFWNDDFLNQLQTDSTEKSLYVIRSIAELNRFVEQVKLSSK